MAYRGRKPKDSSEKSSSNGVWGKSVSKEKSIYATLKEITGTDMKAYYIMFLYCPEYLKEADKKPVKDFEDLKSRYKCFSETITEDICKRYIMEQAALRPDGQMVLEYTSNGMNMWFELWMKAVNKESQYKPFFFSWLDDRYLFLTSYKENSEIYKNRNGRYLTADDLDEEELALYHKMNGGGIYYI